MNLLEALGLCQSGHRVRPKCWRTRNPDHWVEAVKNPHQSDQYLFEEHGTREEMPHVLRLQFSREFLGEWEVVELDAQRRVVNQ